MEYIEAKSPHLGGHARTRQHEVFVRMRLREGGELNNHYPINEEGRREYEEWLAAQSRRLSFASSVVAGAECPRAPFCVPGST